MTNRFLRHASFIGMVVCAIVIVINKMAHTPSPTVSHIFLAIFAGAFTLDRYCTGYRDGFSAATRMTVDPATNRLLRERI